MTLIARLRIILNDVEPMPMRHIEVPLKIRLDRLHEVIQAAMGWTDTHLYEFRVGDAGWGMPHPDGFYDGPMDAKKMTLEKLLDQTATRTIQYVYDFGDDWDHSIRIERVGEATQGVTYPRLLKAAGACPPEDVGGAWGYEEFLEALADAMLPAELLGPYAGLVLLQDANDLFFAETALPHRLSPRLENRLTSNRGLCGEQVTTAAR